MMRAYSGFPGSASQSDAFSDTARTLTSTSWSLGAGVSTSISRSTLGGPYRVRTLAFMAFSSGTCVPRAVPDGPLDLGHTDANGAETNPGPALTIIEDRGSRSQRAGQLAMRMGKVIDGQSDHRPVQQRRRARKGPTTPSDLATRPTTAARTRLNRSE